MSAPAAARYIDITEFLAGATQYSGIESVSYGIQTKEIAASSDADKVDTFLAKGKSTIRGSVKMNDPVQASALQATAAPVTLTFEGQTAAATNHYVKVVITNVLFFNLEGQGMHDDVWGSSVTWRSGAGGSTITITDTVTP